MRFSTSVHYDAPAAQVADLWRREDYQLARAHKAGAERVVVTINGEDELTITVRAEIPSDHVPPAARRFVGSRLQLTTVEVWQAPAADGRRVGSLSLDIAGAPVRVRAHMELTPDGDECVKTYEGEVNANVPLFSGPIERAAVGATDDIVEAEKSIALEFLKRE
ncbi:MAG: DUF2505 domain-containing protein [Bowdeniella nasicola]|nr:DUF2505 domain-containing protein [Bowdeniella nasicola]